MTPTQKKIKALQKKLRSIEELEIKAEAGEELDKQQQSKLDSKKLCETELRQYFGGAAEDDEDDDEDDEELEEEEDDDEEEDA